jgi:hypothetical protein
LLAASAQGALNDRPLSRNAAGSLLWANENDRWIAADDRSHHCAESISRKGHPKTAASRGLTSRQARFILDETSGWGAKVLPGHELGNFWHRFPGKMPFRVDADGGGLMVAMVGSAIALSENQGPASAIGCCRVLRPIRG